MATTATATEPEPSVSPTTHHPSPHSLRVPPLVYDSFGPLYASPPRPRPRPLPARSPLRPPARIIITAMPTVDAAPYPAYTEPTPVHCQNPSFTSLGVLLDSLTNSSDDPPPESPVALSPMDGESGSSTSSLPIPNAPPTSKRTHALLELLSSERAYASDLAFIRDIHIPLALGQRAPFRNAPATPPTSSGSSSRTVSTASDSSSSSNPPPMSREDSKIIFSNVPELALFSDIFTERLEEALGSVLEGGHGQDHVGKLFLDIIPKLEPPYKLYITRHPSAVAHLNTLPQTPALTAYLAQTRSLASSLTHAWDLPSLLIKPVQRLLKYPLLLAAIIDETPDSHEDKLNLKIAKEKMEEVARGVNEGRRRWEVVKEVLSDGPKKRGLSVANIARMKSLRALKPKGENEEAKEVEKLERHLKAADGFVNVLAKASIEWVTAVKISVNHLREWAIGFGKVIGLTGELSSEAFDAFVVVVEQQLIPLCTDLEIDLREKILRELARLITTTTSPLRLLEAMNTLEPFHLSLLNTNLSKNRPPQALIEASQSYLALRGQLYSELPQYLKLLDKGIILSVLELSRLQTQFWADVRDRWSDLWEALRVDGEMNVGAEETMRVWWERWGEVEKTVARLNIVYMPKKIAAEIFAERQVPVNVPTGVRSVLSSLDPPPPAPSMRSPASNVVNTLSSLDPTTSQSTSSQTNRNRGQSEPGTKRTVTRRYSNESFQSGVSGKSGKSIKSPQRPSRPDDYGDYVPAGQPIDSFMPSRVMPGGMSYTPLTPPIFRAGPSSPAPHSAGAYDGYGEWERGRLAQKPSLRRKLTDSLLPSGPPRRRSSSAKSMDSSSHPSGSRRGREREREGPMYPSYPQSTSSSSPRPTRVNWDTVRAKYACRVVHPCYPPPGVSYYDYPFFQLNVGEVFQVLKEAGHPCTHEHLPLYVDDGEDCLLLVRDRLGHVGWALASFLIPED